MPKPKGARKTGGRSKGTPNKATVVAKVDKEIQREILREEVASEWRPMVRRQIAHSKGVAYMVLRHKDGSFTRATDVKQLDAALAAGAESFEIFTQAPNPQSFKDLADRFVDKPAEQLKVTGEDGGPVEHVYRWLREPKS